MTPTIGRVVHYCAHHGDLKPEAAIIIGARLDGDPATSEREEDAFVVNLLVFHDYTDGSSPVLGAPFAKGHEHGHWSWPPRV